MSEAFRFPPIAFSLWLCAAVLSPGGFAAQPATKANLRSLKPEEILSKLDLARPGLEEAEKARLSGDRMGALRELLAYYRRKYSLPQTRPKADRSTIDAADAVTRHVFQWGPYEAADYGEDVDWGWDPRGDIEWVAAVYRFYWAGPLAEAYQATGDDKYVKAFVELTSDWIRKHPLEDRDRIRSGYVGRPGFPWLDIQTGVRAQNLCRVFPVLVHGDSFSPEFLGIFLASLYDHQVKTEALPMNKFHNKAVFEQRGFADIATTFPEFRDARRWMELALKRTRAVFLPQVTADGVQREWSFGYHLGVQRDAVEIMRQAQQLGIRVPDDYRDRVRAMYDYDFAIATPDLAGPMFGDASRHAEISSPRPSLPLYRTLVEGTKLLGDPKYAALANLDSSRLPKQTSYAFPEAGMYVLRDQWGPEQIYLALHCSPPALSSHDQNDNGTFELAAYGRWLMPDTGYFTYGHDKEKRSWHRQTRVHQTLTLDNQNARVDGRHLLWSTSPGLDLVAVENGSYKDLVHRRTVWFVEKKFFVFLDEAIGKARGELALHFQLAPGEAEINTKAHWASTKFPDANVLVWIAPEAPVTLEEEEGWYAWSYGHRVPRKAFCCRFQERVPAAVVSVIFPYRGTQRPQISAQLTKGFRPGDERAVVQVKLSDRVWQLVRALR